MELELRHLRILRAIADAGSLTRAATALGLAQPALSAQLRRIERAFGGALFARGRYGVRATALGELVLERTRVVLPAVSELQREATRFARTRQEAERLRLGATHGPLLGALVDRLADAAPDTTVTTHVSWSERELAELLSEGRLDFALTGACGSAPPPGPPPHRDAGSGPPISRKSLLKAAVAAGAAVPLLSSGTVALARDSAGRRRPLAVTPACDDGDGPTHEQIEGPYFKPDSPLRKNLVDSGVQGTPLTVSGYVFGRHCSPLSGVLLDFWQADDGGNYDMAGYTLRGHQFTEAGGAFSLTTIVPGLYPGRTRHLHVKVQAPGEPVLTTQLYFPGEPRNSTDALFDAALLMNVRGAGNGKEGTFDFVLDVDGTPGPGNPTDPPTDPPSSAWTPGRSYAAGDRVTYQGVSYRCVQAHTSMTGWEPPNVTALWRRE